MIGHSKGSFPAFKSRIKRACGLCGAAAALILLIGVPRAHAADHTDHPACGAACSHEPAHTQLSATSWTPGYTLTGDRYLAADQQVTRDITVTGSARLCLNGHTLTFADGYSLTVEEGGSLELCDCKGTGGIRRGTLTSGGDSSLLVNRGTLTVHGGTYCPDGAGVSLYNTGTLSVSGGSFGIELTNYGTADISGGAVDTRANTNGNYYALYNGEGGTLTVSGGTFLAYNTALYNQGTATLRGGTFRAVRSDSIGSKCLTNKGLLYLRDGALWAEKGYGIYNEYDGGRLYVYGGSVTSQGENFAAVYNRASLTVSGGTLSGYVGIHNGSALSGTEEDGGTCKVSGGTVNGTLCGIRNSGNCGTKYTNGVASRIISRAILEVSGAPSVSGILLEFPDAFTFRYTGTAAVPLEVDLEHFEVGDTLWVSDYTKMSRVELTNDGYVLQYSSADGVVLATDACGAQGDNLRWKLSPDGVLTIFGTGDMQDFGFSSKQPWNYSKTRIYVTRVVMEPGVTSVGTAAFSYLSELTELSVPEGVTHLHHWSLEGLEKLVVLELPSTVTYIGNVFASWVMPGALETIRYNGCIHLWEEVTFASNALTFTPLCRENANEDDGNCLTALYCSVCGGVDVEARQSHTGGTATCTELARCEVCGMSYGDYGHVYDRQAEEDRYLKEEATCLEAAVYYLSCACGARGTETFAGAAAPPGHSPACLWEEHTLVRLCTRCGGDKAVYLTVRYDTGTGILTAEGTVPEGLAVWAAAYDSLGRMTGLAPLSHGSAVSFPEAAAVRLFVPDGDWSPAAPSDWLFGGPVS